MKGRGNQFRKPRFNLYVPDFFLHQPRTGAFEYNELARFESQETVNYLYCSCGYSQIYRFKKPSSMTSYLERPEFFDFPSDFSMDEATYGYFTYKQFNWTCPNCQRMWKAHNQGGRGFIGEWESFKQAVGWIYDLKEGEKELFNVKPTQEAYVMMIYRVTRTWNLQGPTVEYELMGYLLQIIGQTLKGFLIQEDGTFKAVRAKQLEAIRGLGISDSTVIYDLDPQVEWVQKLGFSKMAQVTIEGDLSDYYVQFPRFLRYERLRQDYPYVAELANSGLAVLVHQWIANISNLRTYSMLNDASAYLKPASSWQEGICCLEDVLRLEILNARLKNQIAPNSEQDAWVAEKDSYLKGLTRAEQLKLIQDILG